MRAQRNLSPDAQEKLRALGYFGFRAAVSAEALKQGLPDPKDKLWEFNSILKAEDAFQRKEDDQAEALLTEVQQKDPQIYVIPFLLGESALRRQNWERAADQLQRCLALNPNFDNAMTGLARALAKLGRVDEARSWLSKAVQSNPQNYRAWYQMGLLDRGSDPAAALVFVPEGDCDPAQLFAGAARVGPGAVSAEGLCCRGNPSGESNGTRLGRRSHP